MFSIISETRTCLFNNVWLKTQSAWEVAHSIGNNHSQLFFMNIMISFQTAFVPFNSRSHVKDTLLTVWSILSQVKLRNVQPSNISEMETRHPKFLTGRTLSETCLQLRRAISGIFASSSANKSGTNFKHSWDTLRIERINYNLFNWIRE